MGTARFVIAAGTAAALALLTPGLQVATAAAPPDPLVSVGSPPSPFSQNKQNEPAVAIDAHAPNVVVAGANEEIDEESCAAGDPSTCPFTAGVGVSGVYFSFDSGASWTPADLHAAGRLATASGRPRARRTSAPSARCPTTSRPGWCPTATRLSRSARDGAPMGRFSFSNGSRLYYANLTSNFGATRTDATFKGFEAIAVSHADDVTAAATRRAVGLVGAGARSPSSRRPRSPTRSRSGRTTRPAARTSATSTSAGRRSAATAAATPARPR